MAVSTGILADKVVVITGASKGIGADSARLFAREGAALMLGGRDESGLSDLVDEITGAGGQAAYRVGDIADAADVHALVQGAVDTWGRLDGAFNNAGINQYGVLAEITEADFDRIMAVNVKGVWLSLREEVAAMKAAGNGGSIVNTSSVGGYKGSSGLGAYQATKHAVIGLTRTAAHDNGPAGIRVNVVAPGATETPMMVAWRAEQPEQVARRVAAIPFGRAADPAEVGEAAAWLISERSGTINGVVLPIDGGFSS